MVGRDGDVRGASTNHAQGRREHASHRGDFAAIAIPGGRQRVIVPEQFVRPSIR